MSNPVSTPIAQGSAAAPVGSTISPASAGATVVTQAGALAPVYVIPSHEADDALIALARDMGHGDELGLPAEKPEEKSATDGTATPASGAPGSQAPPVEGATAAKPGEGAASETPEQKVARLEKELADLKAGKTSSETGGAESPVAGASGAPAPSLDVIVPATPENPLANLRSTEQVDRSQSVASQVKAWAIQNREGGEIPATLLQAIEDQEALRFGRKPTKVTAPAVVTAKDAAAIEAQAEQMLANTIPQRRQFLANQNHALGVLQKESPEFLDIKKPEGQRFASLAAELPVLLTHPGWPIIMRDLVAGFMARQKAAPAEEKKPTPESKPEVQAPAPHSTGSGPTVPAGTVLDAGTGKPVPIAPGAPLGGNGSAAPSGGPTQKALDEAMARHAKGESTEDDLLILSANAV